MSRIVINFFKSCFKCGGTSSHEGCKKTMTLDGYLEHENEPFCKSCYGKLFGPKGYGFGSTNTLLNSYVYDPVTATNATPVSNSSTSKNAPPPPPLPPKPST